MISGFHIPADELLDLIEAVREMGVVRHFPGRSESDLYRWLIENQAALRDQHELETDLLPKSAQAFLEFLDNA